MSNEHFTLFRGVNHFNEPLIINEIEYGLKNFCDYAFLKIGAWENVTTGTLGVYGGSLSQLHVVDDPNFTDNTVFQGIRKDWIWETGINYSSPTGGTFNPLSIQVYVSGTLVNTGTSGHTHHINYPLGRVVFDSPHSTGAIKAQYSYRAVQTYLADDLNWWFEIQYNTFNPIEKQWLQNLTSGDFSLSATNRIQLPAVVIECLSNRYAQPFELGTLVARNKQDVLFHVISQDRYTRNNMVDIFTLMQNKTIILGDTDTIYRNQAFPLDERGMKLNNALMYPDIVGNTNYVFRTAFIDNIVATDIKTDHPNLHWAIIRAKLEVIY